MTKPVDQPFWDFSGSLYGAPGVAAECLLLQDDYGVDVNVLLFCAYAAAVAGLHLSDANLAAVESQVVEIRTGVVAPLRECRRAMKEAVGKMNNDRERAEQLRSQVKELELAAERLEQERLAAWLSTHARAGDQPDAGAIVGNINRLLARHKGSAGSFPEKLVQTAQLLIK